jgi:hypothetical protein
LYFCPDKSALLVRATAAKVLLMFLSKNLTKKPQKYCLMFLSKKRSGNSTILCNFAFLLASAHDQAGTDTENTERPLGLRQFQTTAGGHYPVGDGRT